MHHQVDVCCVDLDLRLHWKLELPSRFYMDQLTYRELAQLRDALTTPSNTNFCCAMKAHVFIYTNIGRHSKKHNLKVSD